MQKPAIFINLVKLVVLNFDDLSALLITSRAYAILANNLTLLWDYLNNPELNKFVDLLFRFHKCHPTFVAFQIDAFFVKFGPILKRCIVSGFGASKTRISDEAGPCASA